ncbi:MAG TPA: 3-keto-5-aminohexanoate cleavage protein [Solirubrobacteraceae bacterium]|nr:3-keto-5-aminohexanoate cleavage protein [Solirubrobacteraceae bacterium]
MFLQAALNGSRAPGEHDALPLTPEELARDARAAVEAGASALHVHPRGEDGRESLEPAACDAAVAALRAAVPKIELSITTGLWITGGDVERRLEAVRGWSELPDIVSLNVAEEGWRELGELLAGRGVWIEIGLFFVDHPQRLAESGLASHCRRALVEPQETAPETAVATAGTIDGLLDRAGVDLPQLHHGTDFTTWAVLDAAVHREREIRIGLEDTFHLPDARRAGSNAELVAAAAARYRVSRSG